MEIACIFYNLAFLYLKLNKTTDATVYALKSLDLYSSVCGFNSILVS